MDLNMTCSTKYLGNTGRTKMITGRLHILLNESFILIKSVLHVVKQRLSENDLGAIGSERPPVT